MTDLVPVKVSSLPATYQAAKTALERCVEIDECEDYADKAKALAVYAMQSKDESLYKMAVRIRARAIRRAGELLAQVAPSKGGQPTHAAGGTGRAAVAAAAGLSPRQKVTALRVAAVPSDRFESQVESDRPPSIKVLARQGTKPQPKREVSDPRMFAESTQGQAAIGVLFRATKKADPKIVARGATKREQMRMASETKEVSKWLGKLTNELRRLR